MDLKHIDGFTVVGIPEPRDGNAISFEQFSNLNESKRGPR